MTKAAILATLLLIGGCGMGGDRGELAPASARTSTATGQTALETMPPEAGASAKASMDRGAAMGAQYEKMYGKGR